MSDLSAYGLPIPSAGPRRASELLSITDRLSKALDDFDSMYDDGNDDTMLTELSEKVNDLQSGELKFQMKGFITKYKEINTNLETVSTERDEILGSLQDWFEMASLDMDIAGGADGNEDELVRSEKELKDSMCTTKMNFEKLKRIKEEIETSGHRGRDVGHLKAEKEELEKKVISQFKDYSTKKKEVAKTNTVQDADLQKAWGHAAEEICGMLKNVRDQGADYLVGLEKKIKEMSKTCDQFAIDLKKAKGELEQKVIIEKKWTEDNMELTNQKARIAQKLRKYKKELIEVRKRLKQHEPLNKLGRSVLETDEDNDTSSAPSAPPNSPMLRTDGDPTMAVMQLKDARKTIAKLENEKTLMQENINSLNEILEEKEEDISMLEHDKAELLHQMKKASVRPDVKQLSQAMIADSFSTRKMSRGPSVAGVKIQSEAQVSSKSCHCTCQKNAHEPPKPRPSIKLLTTSSSKSITQLEDAREALERETLELKTRLQLIENDCMEKDNVIKTVKTKLLSAQQEISRLQEARLDEGDFPKDSSKVQEVNLEPQSTVSSKGSIVSYETTPTKVMSEDASMDTQEEENGLDLTDIIKPSQHEVAESKGEKHIKSHPVHVDPSPEEIEKVVVKTVYVKETVHPDGTRSTTRTVNSGMQTDPSLDPISGWSKVETTDRTGWRPPMPPASWINYDPTPNLPQVMSKDGIPVQTESIGIRMMKGVEPSEIRHQTIQCVNFIEREVDRMSQGLQSFLEIINSVIEQDSGLMTTANRELRSHLTQTELNDLEQELRRPPSVGLRGSHLSIKESDNEALSSSEKDLKRKVTEMTEKVVNALTQTSKVLYNSLLSQHRQYEQIFETFQKNPREFSVKNKIKEMEAVKERPKPTVKRSLSHDSLLELIRIRPDEEDEDSLPRPTRSKSMVEIPQAKHVLNMLDLEAQFDHSYSQHARPVVYATDPSVAKNKEEMRVAAATVPKRGMIRLEVNEKDPKFKFPEDQEYARKKVKPAPMSHKKLMAKQKDLMNKNGQSVKGGVRRKVVKQKEPKPDYVGFSMAEIERGADEIRENAVSRGRQELVADKSKAAKENQRAASQKRGSPNGSRFPPLP